jgi:molybdenum-dependent DNA-binding transcriptional regulator ModE
MTMMLISTLVVVEEDMAELVTQAKVVCTTMLKHLHMELSIRQAPKKMGKSFISALRDFIP